MTDKQLRRLLNKYDCRIEKFEEEKSYMADLRREIVAAFHELGYTEFTLNNGVRYTMAKWMKVYQGGKNKDDVREFFRDIGQEKYVYSEYNNERAYSVLKDLIDDNDGELPEELVELGMSLARDGHLRRHLPEAEEE